MATDSGTKVALVTGASRGIGKAAAIELARAGFDVVICARTLHEGEAREHSSTVDASDTSPLPGSLDKTAAEIAALGRRALSVRLDLNDPAQVEAAAASALKEFGRVDVLVNNARYVGPGHMDPFPKTAIGLIETHLRCNVLAPLQLTQLLLPHMVARGGGIVVNLASSSGWMESASLPGSGGAGISYGLSKAAINRAGPGLAKELKKDNVAVISVDPGFVGTERTEQDMGKFGFSMATALSVEVPGKTIAHLATHPYPMFFSGRTVLAPHYAIEHALVDPATMPREHGPESWGVPKPFKWLGG